MGDVHARSSKLAFGGNGREDWRAQHAVPLRCDFVAEGDRVGRPYGGRKGEIATLPRLIGRPSDRSCRWSLDAPSANRSQ
jgi:hypothetical protein